MWERKREEEETDVDEVGTVAGAEVVHDRGFVQERQVGDIVPAIELGRIHLAQVLMGDIDVSVRDPDVAQPCMRTGTSNGVLDDPGGEVALGRVRQPDALLLGKGRLGRGVLQAGRRNGWAGQTDERRRWRGRRVVAGHGVGRGGIKEGKGRREGEREGLAGTRGESAERRKVSKKERITEEGMQKS